MRLKGGKVLLDLTGYGEISSLTLNEEQSVFQTKQEIKTILEKGLCVKIKFRGNIVSCDVIWNGFEEHYFASNKFIDGDNDNFLMFSITNDDVNEVYNLRFAYYVAE